MPRIEGVSCRSITWLRRVKPSPRMTNLCLRGAAIAERTHCRCRVAGPAAAAAVCFFFPAMLQLLRRLATQRRDGIAVLQYLERIESRFDHIVWVRCADGLGEHVLHSGGCHVRAHRAARA